MRTRRLSRTELSDGRGFDQERGRRECRLPITDEAFEFLIARAGLSLSDAEKAELKDVCDGIAAMAARVRQPRGRMAEPALTYGFAEEDL